ncbi:MAG: acyl--CoA ligase [Gammaproteobacteria bacterium]|nr:acyl--CoA ligase [Gammaproteobacteria bacterium]
MSNLLHKIDQAYKNHQEKKVLITRNQTLSYLELKHRVNNVADGLFQLGIKPHSLVASILPNDIDFVILMLAIAKLNATLVPLSFGTTNKALVQAQKTLQFKHIVCWYALYSEKQASLSANEISNWISVGKDISGLERLENWYSISDTNTSDNKISELDSAYILTMTSGSTGTPKPIELSQNTKILRAKAAIDLYSITERDTTLVATPLYHSLAQRLIFLSLLSGGTAIIMNKFNMSGWLDCIATHHVTFTIAVSSQLKQLNNYLINNSADLNSFRCLVSSSALLDYDTKAQLLKKLKCEFHECYGASEIAIATNIKFDSTNKNMSVGHAIANTDIVILDDDRNELAIGEVGEIACKTPMKFSGYYKQPKLTAESFYGDYFCTGDLGKFDKNKQLYYIARKKEIIITGGINVYPSDIEEVVKAQTQIDNCIAFALHDENLGEIVALAIIPKTMEELSTLVNQIRVICATELDHHQQPRVFFFFSSFPQNAMSKINKLEIQKIAEQSMHNAKQEQQNQAVIHSRLYFKCD